VTGITGARTELPAELAEGLRHMRKISSRPVAVGFGISEPEQVRMLSEVADGVIVGSAIVRIIENHLENTDSGYAADNSMVESVGDFVKSLKEATIGSGD
jgi:tryptophan synthase alpha chain